MIKHVYLDLMIRYSYQNNKEEFAAIYSRKP